MACRPATNRPMSPRVTPPRLAGVDRALRNAVERTVSRMAPGLAMKDLLLKGRDPLKRYGLALVSTALTLLIRGVLEVPVGTTVYQLPLAAIVMSAWYGGRGPGLAATVVS